MNEAQFDPAEAIHTCTVWVNRDNPAYVKVEFLAHADSEDVYSIQKEYVDKGYIVLENSIHTSDMRPATLNFYKVAGADEYTVSKKEKPNSLM